MRRPKVFVVHGHNERARLEVCEMLRTDLQLEPVLLMNEPGMTATLIDSFEQRASECSGAVVIMTGDDEVTSDEAVRRRARQNVIFELGYLCGLMGRSRVCLVYEVGVEMPSDLSGVIYYRFENSIREIAVPIRRHLEELGLVGTSAGLPLVLVVDDDLREDEAMFRQIAAQFEGHAEVQLLHSAAQAKDMIRVSPRIVGVITDIVFRDESSVAGTSVAEAALARGADVVVITGHPKQAIAAALSELGRLGIDRDDILRKPATVREQRAFLDAIRSRIAGGGRTW